MSRGPLAVKCIIRKTHFSRELHRAAGAGNKAESSNPLGACTRGQGRVHKGTLRPVDYTLERAKRRCLTVPDNVANLSSRVSCVRVCTCIGKCSRRHRCVEMHAYDACCVLVASRRPVLRSQNLQWKFRSGKRHSSHRTHNLCIRASFARIRTLLDEVFYYKISTETG